MASSSQKVLEEISETLLSCKICEEPFDQRVRLPRVLPCHHTFCGACIAKLDRGGNLKCPNCRKDIQVTGPFPVDTTRGALLDYAQVIQTAQEAPCEACDDGGQATSRCLDCTQALCEECRAAHKRVKTARDHVIVSLEEAASSPSLLLQKVKCQKHANKKLKYFCKTCDSAICSTCVIVLHKDRDGHDIVELGEVLEQAKREIETMCVDFDHIRESILQPRAEMAATSLQEVDASFQDAAKEIEDVFIKAANTLLDRKTQAMEQLRSKWKADRLELEEQAAVTESQTTGAKTSTALGRTVSSVGLPNHVLSQKKELQRAVQEAKAEGGKPLQSSPRYKVNTNLSGLMTSVRELGTVHAAEAPPNPNTGLPLTRMGATPGQLYMGTHPAIYGVQPQVYGYDEMMHPGRIQMANSYYDLAQFQVPTPLAGRDTSGLTNVPYSGSADSSKLARVEAQSPNATSQSGHNPPQQPNFLPFVYNPPQLMPSAAPGFPQYPQLYQDSTTGSNPVGGGQGSNKGKAKGKAKDKAKGYGSSWNN